MNTIMKKYGSITVAAMLVFACDSGDEASNDNGQNDRDYSGVIEQFVGHTILPTYANLKDETIELYGLVSQLSTHPEQVLVDSACATWRKARIPWEQSEAFLFGPAEFRSLDPLLDSWPLDQSQLEQVLASNQELTAAYVRDGLGAVLRGFHTIEYLLFRDGVPRSIDSMSAREKEYLVAVTQVLRDDAVTLWALWHGADGMDSLETAIMAELEIDVGTGYAAEFLQAGNAGSRYVSQLDAVGEIMEGCIGIADEIGNAKIAEPFQSGNPLLVESWFSWNSLDDFHNNVLSIENSLYGGLAGDRNGESLASIVKELDASLEARLAADIQGALDAIDAIPEPFRNNLDKTTEINAAIDALNQLTATLEDVRAMFAS